MAVYVDNAFIPYGRMLMCHMGADSLTELHEMADKVGLKRRWFQEHKLIPHYDLCKRKRGLAIELGAIEVSSRDFLVRLKNTKPEAQQR